MPLRILCYHEIEPAMADRFSAQLDFFAQRGCRFVPLTEALQSLQDDCLTVSFDDGDYSLCEVAQPILDARGIRGIVYLSTDFVLQGTTYKSRNPVRAVSWDQLGHWLEAGHEIGSHTHTHVNLTHCQADMIQDEVERSREIVKRELGAEIKHFAYPWGQHDAKTREWFAQDGTWASVATIERGVNTVATDRLCLKRDLINPDFDSKRMWWIIIAGYLNFLYKIQANIRKRI